MQSQSPPISESTFSCAVRTAAVPEPTWDLAQPSLFGPLELARLILMLLLLQLLLLLLLLPLLLCLSCSFCVLKSLIFFLTIVGRYKVGSSLWIGWFARVSSWLVCCGVLCCVAACPRREVGGEERRGQERRGEKQYSSPGPQRKERTNNRALKTFRPVRKFTIFILSRRGFGGPI